MSRQAWELSARKALGLGVAIVAGGLAQSAVAQNYMTAPAGATVYLTAPQAPSMAQTQIVGVSEPYVIGKDGKQTPVPAQATTVAQGGYSYELSSSNNVVYVGDASNPVPAGAVIYEAPATSTSYGAPQVYAPAPQRAETVYLPAQPYYEQPKQPEPVNVGMIGDYFVQVAAFKGSSRAEKLMSRLLAQGENAFIEPARVNGSLYHRVRVGPLNTDHDARNALRRVRGMGFADARVVKK